MISKCAINSLSYSKYFYKEMVLNLVLLLHLTVIIKLSITLQLVYTIHVSTYTYLTNTLYILFIIIKNMINLVKDMLLNYRGNQIIKFAFHFLN